jgi:hypothetical protein
MNGFSANVGRPPSAAVSVMKNDYIENKQQAQLNKARGQGYAGVGQSSFALCASMILS